MDFFKSVFSDEMESTESSQPHESDEQTGEEPESDSTETVNPTSTWSFGGLIKTLATKSESVIQTYRKDLEELGSGLKKETALIKEVASRAVKDFPASLDTGASVAQESLESVGQVIDDIGSTVWKSTAEIISHGRETLLAADLDSDYFDSKDSIFNTQQLNSNSSSQVLDAKRYSRFEEKVRALQCDSNTYLEEPEALDNYNEWKSGFALDDKKEDIDRLIKENAVIEEIYGEVVPDRIDHELFWNRYFYRQHILKQAEDAREKFVKRAISGDEEEDLSWDFDDDVGENGGYEPRGNSSGKGRMTAEVAADHGLVENVITREKELLTNEEKDVPKSIGVAMDKLGAVADGTETASDNGDKSEKMSTEGKTENVASDISIISSQPSMPEEEDLGWDEIEDVGSNDGNKEDTSGVTTRDDLRKRLSAADQEEDLSWDIEDDDEPAKS